ncbi:MAG: hypothetical protein ACREHV_08685 [Rhizomicrobium sp.]
MARDSSGSPAEDLQIPAHIFDERRTAFNPVAVLPLATIMLRRRDGFVNLPARPARSMLRRTHILRVESSNFSKY